MKIPTQIQNFITQKIVFTNYCLPQSYPDVSSFEDFQDGYKINGNTGEILTGTKKGDFLAEWFVICSSYTGAPFFININEESDGFPVYFAWNGAGKWTPIKVAVSILEFENQLKLLKSAKNIKATLKEKFDLSNEFWKEVYDEEEGETFSEDKNTRIKSIQNEKKQLEKKQNEIYSKLRDLNNNKEISRNEFYAEKKKLEKEISLLNVEIRAKQTLINKISWE